MQWTYLGMRENTYLVAAVVFISTLLTYVSHEHFSHWLKKYRWTKFGLEVALIGGVTAGLFVFLRPISQFIYFQF